MPRTRRPRLGSWSSSTAPSATAEPNLERRGLDQGTIRVFRLGYAPDDGQALRRALAARGFSDEEMLAVGLLAVPEGGGAPYARLRQRAIFPIQDGRGRQVGFGGRALGEARAKYLNTPETALFRKGELLYNLARAAPAARERRGLVLAEGYMDVIALHRAGFPNAVAPLGTAVTEPQLQLLWRHAEAPVVCLDGDRAGLAAAARAAERALPLMQAGRSLRFAVLPEGEDPDSFVAREGAEAMGQVLQRAHNLSDMLWRIETQGKRFDSAETQAGLRRRLREITRLAADPDLRASLDATFAQRIEAAFPRRRPWRQEGGGAPKARRVAGEGAGASRLAARITNPGNANAMRILAPILSCPGWLPMIEEDLAALELEDERLNGLRQEILAWFADRPSLDAAGLQSHLTRYGFGSLLDQLAPLGAAHKVAEGETAQLEAWRGMLVGYRERQAKRSQRPTDADVHAAEDRDINLWFRSLDPLLNQGRRSDVSPDDEGGTTG